MIEQHIPHRGPARLIDRLVTADADGVVVDAEVPAEGRFVRDGAMPSWVGIELMAQAVAAWSGHRAVAAGRPVQVGYLLGTRRYESFCDGFAAGSTLRVTARRDFIADSGVGMFSCRIHGGERLLAEAQISVYEPAGGELG